MRCGYAAEIARRFDLLRIDTNVRAGTAVWSFFSRKTGISTWFKQWHNIEMARVDVL